MSTRLLPWSIACLAATTISVVALADNGSSGAPAAPTATAGSSATAKPSVGAGTTKEGAKKRKRRLSTGSVTPPPVPDKDAPAKGAGAKVPDPKTLAELDADCVVFERIEPEPPQASYVFSKFFVRLADGTREVREVEINANKEYARSKVGDKLCAKPPKYPD